jgi:ribosomal protein S18 acetylase RimI-like enzyme
MYNIIVRLAEKSDINELAELFDRLCDRLESGTNYPGWKKGVYPDRRTAELYVGNGELHVITLEGRIAGTIVLSKEPEEAYDEVKWRYEWKYDNLFVIRTFTVDPEFWGIGLGERLLDHAASYGRRIGIKAMRLDVLQTNLPAIGLYEKSGFEYAGTVDLRLNIPGLKWFRLYEKSN